jgi:hypothetical protein
MREHPSTPMAGIGVPGGLTGVVILGVRAGGMDSGSIARSPVVRGCCYGLVASDCLQTVYHIR